MQTASGYRHTFKGGVDDVRRRRAHRRDARRPGARRPSPRHGLTRSPALGIGRGDRTPGDRNRAHSGLQAERDSGRPAASVAHCHGDLRAGSARTVQSTSTRSGCRRPSRRSGPPSGPPADRARAGPCHRRPSPRSARRRAGSTRRSFLAMSLTYVGSQPVLAMPTSTRHTPSPSAVDATVDAPRCTARRAPGTRRTRRAGGPRRPAGRAAGWSTCCMSSQPPISTGPSCGWSNGRHGTNISGWCSSAQRRTASSSSSVGPVYQKCVRLLGAGRRVDDVPELGGPAEHAEVLVGPVVGGAAHRHRLVPGEVLEHASATG